mmetsp:Transcript_142193/g.250868  ORF Transcript_142193/g.250868 Transcript_142193/m.250868 type:complete len:442 (-) Transcript_142193:152-1477(-)
MDRSDAAVDQDVGDSKRERIIRNMFLISLLHLATMVMGGDVKMQVFLKHFKGDTAACSRIHARNTSVSSASGLLIIPLFASLMDVFGRKPLFLFSTAWGFGMRLADMMSQSIMVSSATTCSAAPLQGVLQASNTFIADLFPGDPSGAGNAITFMQSTRSVSTVVVPLISGWLAEQDIRLNYALAACFSAAATCLTARLLPETLPVKKKVPLAEVNWQRGLNPFRFLCLFTSGPRLAMAAMGEAVRILSEGPMLLASEMLVNTATLNWGLLQRSRFVSACGAQDALALTFAGKFAQRFDPSVSMLIGGGSRIAAKLLNFGLVSSTWGQYAILPVALPSGLNGAALQAVLLDAGDAAGLGKAELQGALQSLRLLATLVQTRLASAWYARCVAAGNPRRFHLGAAAVSIMQLLLGLLALAMSPSRGDKSANSPRRSRRISMFYR